MSSRRSLSTFSLFTLIFPLLIAAQGYDFGLPPPSLPTSSDPAQQSTPPYQNTPPGSYNPNPPPNQGVYGWNPSPSPTDPGIYVAPPNQYVSKPPSQHAPYASAPSNPVYGPPPANPTPPRYIPPPSYGNGIYPSGPILSSPTSSTFSAVPTISNSTVPIGGATTTASAAGAFSSLTSLSMTGGCVCLAQATSITTVTHTCISTVTSVLTEVKTETVTVSTINLVGGSVVSNVSTPATFSPVPTTMVVSTVGVNLNSSSTIQNGGTVNTTTASSPTAVVGSSVYGSPLSYVTPTPWGTYGSPSGYAGGKSRYSSQPLKYNQPSTYNDGGDDDNGYGALPSNGEEGGSSEAGSESGSYGDGGEYGGDTDDDGDVETESWGLGSAPNSEGGSESNEQGGGSSFLD